MIRLHRSLILLLVALMVAGCGAADVSTPPIRPTTSASPSSAPAPTASLAATAQSSALVELPTSQPPPPTVTPAPPSPVPPTQAPAAPATATPNPPATSFGDELLFLRQGELWAFDLATSQERQIAEQVRDFASSPDRTMIALLRGDGRQSEIWIVGRDGSGLTQLSHNERAEAMLSWSPDRQALLFASSTAEIALIPEWQSWSHWCAASEVHLLLLADMSERSLASGCDPAFSPDGKRIAYAAPPRQPEQGYPDDPPLIGNSIRLINTQGENGWNFAQANGPEAAEPNSGRLVYAPSWSTDGSQVVYQRFVGYQALVDISLSEIGGSLEGKGQLLNDGAGWLMPSRFAPDGQRVAISENNYGDARGFGGYDNWSVSVIDLAGSHEVFLPSGTFTALGQRVDRLPRGQAAVWLPDGVTLAVELPPGWTSGLSPNEPVGADQQPGEVWRWRPGDQPDTKLFSGVDYASPLVVMPAI